ncbi:hypothetical protein WJX81_005765 [Elliptochloris bilobata]|uniref:Photosystem II 11 kDa protein n=1 Tax=Elliptochloris bilobata TaxID=381761 RepID=A0AAW1SLS7_9CHLO
MAALLLTPSFGAVGHRNAFKSSFRARQQAALPIRAQAQHVDVPVSRRGAAAAVAAGLALLSAGSASAFLGFGEPSKEEIYKDETSSVLKAVSSAISLGKDEPGKEDVISSVRKQTNEWVAKYRRDNSFAGRPSYGQTYAAVNALAGHYNSFGPTAPLPKKRLERLRKELEDAEKYLTRGR